MPLSVRLAALGGALALAGPAVAQQAPHVFRGATILPVVGAPIANGAIVVQNGKITAIGPAASVAVPAGATVVDVTGRTIMPGIVDSHSHIGGADGGDQSNSMHPSVRVLDAIDARDDGIKRARAGGLTTVNVMPGSGLLMSGQTLYIKLRDGNTVNDLLVLCTDPMKEVCGGMKMANGTNPRGGGGTANRPGTRARSAAIVRDRFTKAIEYRTKVRNAGGDASKLPARDLELEALVEVLDGKRTVHFHTHRHDDIMTVLRLQKEFGFKLVLQHVTDGHLVANEIAAAKVPASIIILESPGGKLEAMSFTHANGQVLDKAGVLVGFHTDDGVTDSRFFLRAAALAVRAGMPRQKALEALTIANARMMDLDRRVGSLEVGKDADFIVLTGDPFSSYTVVEQTWIEGRKLFDRADPEQRKWQTGGLGAGRMQMHVHEDEEDGQ